MMTLNAVVTGFKDWGSYWERFRSSHTAWFRDRRAEGDEVFFIPIAHETEAFSCAFGTTADDIAAEEAFTGLCREFSIIGVRVVDAGNIEPNVRFMRYEGLDASAAATDDTWLERGRDIGWSEAQIANARIALRRADDMQLRMVSAAGRLVCMPAFLAERDTLRERWTSLPPAERPTLPLRPILHVKDQPPGTRRRNLSEVATRFIVDFEGFCQKWQLNGFEAWHLPDPRGPQWPSMQAVQGAMPASGNMVLFTPWHFPVLDSDNLGRPAMEQHLADRRCHGIDDSRSWQTYAQLLRLDFWERVLRGRYNKCDRVPGFVRQMEGLLAELLQVSLDRIERLRKFHGALLSGKKRSLRGVR
jgi:hypothetical protein